MAPGDRQIIMMVLRELFLKFYEDIFVIAMTAVKMVDIAEIKACLS